jgi:hypothetical protein
MLSDGYGYLKLDFVVGLHDYEQYFRDIYRKAFFHAHKHKDEIKYWECLWRKLCCSDADYRVALKGAKDGREYKGEVFSDLGQFDSVEYEMMLNYLGLTEKSELPSDYWSLEDVRIIVTNHFPSSEYWAWRANSGKRNPRGETAWEKIHMIRKTAGFLKSALWASGGFLERGGKILRKWSDI